MARNGSVWFLFQHLMFSTHIFHRNMSKSCPPQHLWDPLIIGSHVKQDNALASLKQGLELGGQAYWLRYRKWSSLQGSAGLSLTRIQCFVLFCLPLISPVLDPGPSCLDIITHTLGCFLFPWNLGADAFCSSVTFIFTPAFRALCFFGSGLQSYVNNIGCLILL